MARATRSRVQFQSQDTPVARVQKLHSMYSEITAQIEELEKELVDLERTRRGVLKREHNGDVVMTDMGNRSGYVWRNGGDGVLEIKTSVLLPLVALPAHAVTHQVGGVDVINVNGLAGVLANAQMVMTRRNAGADVGPRPRLNFIEGANITLGVVDDAIDNEVDITITAAGGVGAHNILSATHSDSTVAACVRGDLITGQGLAPTWTRYAISVPGANLMNVFGVVNGDTEPGYKAIFDANNPTTIGIGDVAAPGTAVIAAHRDHQHQSPATWTATSHSLLSAIHGDTTAAACVRGDIIVGIGLAPLWTRYALAVPAANIRNVMGVDNGEVEPTWKAGHDAVMPETIAVGGAGQAGTSLLFSHRDHNHPAPATWTPSAHTHDGDTLQHDGVNSNGGAFTFNTTGAVTHNQNLQAAGLSVGRALSAGYLLDIYSAAAHSAIIVAANANNKYAYQRFANNVAEILELAVGGSAVPDTIFAISRQSLGSVITQPGYALAIGTAGPQSLYFGTNNITAITVSLAQEITCVGTHQCLRASIGIAPHATTALLVEKDTGGVYSDATISAMFGDIDGADSLYFIGNTINTASATDTDNQSMVINYRGYNGGVTRDRNFLVYDGKGASIMACTGSTKATVFAGTVTVSTIANGAGNFLTHNAGLINQRTAAQTLTDIGAQPLDSFLTSIAALGTAADKMIYTTGVDTAAETGLTAFARTILDDADAATVRTTLGLVIGTNVQAYDAFLTSIALLGTAADKIIYTTGVDTAAETALTASARTALAITVVRGDILYASGAATLARLPVGAAGTLLRSDGTDVAWATLATAGIQPLDADLTAIAALAGTGILCHTGVGTWAERTLAAPAAGITVTNPGGVAGNITLVLANDLAALEGLAATGIACRSAADTWVQRTITSTCGFTVTNAGGVAGNIDIGLTTDTPQILRVGIGALADAAAKLNIVSPLGADMIQYWHADNSTNNESKWRVMVADATGTLSFSNFYNGATYTDWLSIAADGEINAATLVLSGALTLSALGGAGTRLATISNTGAVSATLTPGLTNVGLIDTNATHYLRLVAGSDLTADRNLTFTTGDSARTITLSGNPTLADWFDQSVKVAATPQFAQLGIGVAVADTNLITANSTGNAVIRTVTSGNDKYGLNLVEAGGGAVQLSMYAYGTTYVYGGTLFGVDPKGYAVVASNNGLLIGTYNSHQLIIGTNSTAAITISTAQAVACASTVSGTQFTSTIAIGTAPLVVTSTTVCTNLNADLWDGYQFADYLNQGVKTTSTPQFLRVGIGGAAHASDELTVVGTSTFSDTIIAASTIQATGLGLGRAKSAAYVLDVYAATGDCEASSTAGDAGFDHWGAFAARANSNKVQIVAYGTAYVGSLGTVNYADMGLLDFSACTNAVINVGSASPLYLMTNSTIAVTISSAQAVTCASRYFDTAQFYSTRYTEYTDSGHANYWYPLITVDIPSQYQYASAIIVLSGQGLTSETMGGTSIVYLRVKQQAAMGDDPVIEVTNLIGSVAIFPMDIVFVLTTNDASHTAGTLYVRDRRSYNAIDYTVLNREGYSTVVASNTAGVSALPAGTQYAAYGGFIVNTDGPIAYGREEEASIITMSADAGGDNNDYSRFYTLAGNYLWQEYGGGSWRTNLAMDSSGYIYSEGINRASGTGTTVKINTSTMQVYKDSSAREYKMNIQDWETSVSGKSVLDLRLRQFKYRDWENYYEEYIDKDGKTKTKTLSRLSDHASGSVEIGLIAEEVADIFPEVVGYTNGKPDYINYDRLVVPLIAEVKKLRDRIVELEKAV